MSANHVQKLRQRAALGMREHGLMYEEIRQALNSPSEYHVRKMIDAAKEERARYGTIGKSLLTCTKSDYLHMCTRGAAIVRGKHTFYVIDVSDEAGKNDHGAIFPVISSAGKKGVMIVAYDIPMPEKGTATIYDLSDEDWERAYVLCEGKVV